MDTKLSSSSNNQVEMPNKVTPFENSKRDLKFFLENNDKFIPLSTIVHPLSRQ
jgi:hypothetical protein